MGLPVDFAAAVVSLHALPPIVEQGVCLLNLTNYYDFSLCIKLILHLLVLGTGARAAMKEC